MNCRDLSLQSCAYKLVLRKLPKHFFCIFRIHYPNGENAGNDTGNDVEFLSRHPKWKNPLCLTVLIISKNAIFIDNQVCWHTLPKGSKIPELNKLIIEILDLALELDAVIVDVAWIPTELNVIPDQLSRLIDTNDWVVTEATWAMCGHN